MVVWRGGVWWGYTTALLLAIISTVSLNHVAQLTDFTGPIKGPMENSGPVYTSQGKHGSAYKVSGRFSVVELGFHLYSQRHKNHNGIVCKIKNRPFCGGFVVFITTKSLKSYYKLKGFAADAAVKSW